MEGNIAQAAEIGGAPRSGAREIKTNIMLAKISIKPLGNKLPIFLRYSSFYRKIYLSYKMIE